MSGGSRFNRAEYAGVGIGVDGRCMDGPPT